MIKYEAPELEIITFAAEDIITASTMDPNDPLAPVDCGCPGVLVAMGIHHDSCPLKK